MKRSNAILWLMAVWLLAPVRANALDIKSLFREASPSVVAIISLDAEGKSIGYGTGFYVADGKTVVTCLHVVRKAHRIVVAFSKEEYFLVDALHGIDREMDVAVLPAREFRSPLQLATMGSEVGEEVVAIGNPKGLDRTVSPGIISGIRNLRGGRHYQITAPISPGSSGGPVLTEWGLVAGMSTFVMEGGQNLNFAVPAETISSAIYNPKFIELPMSEDEQP